MLPFFFFVQDGVSSLIYVPEDTSLSLNFTSILFYSGNAGGSVNISVGGQ